MERVIPNKWKQEKAGTANLTSDKVGFKSKLVRVKDTPHSLNGKFTKRIL